MKRSQQKKLYTIGIIAVTVLIVGLLTWYVLASRSAAPQNTTTMSETMETGRFATLKGNEFDEAFLADMLAHHEGAINMAEMVGAGTERQELRDFAQTIMTAQSSEIASMRQWQADWGFAATAGGHGAHSGMAANDMAGEMMDMGESLAGLTGSAFEKRFLELMTEHHQQAVEMARYAETNSNRSEIKTLAKNIIDAQNQEIDQMKRWLIEWGYTNA